MSDSSPSPSRRVTPIPPPSQSAQAIKRKRDSQELEGPVAKKVAKPKKNKSPKLEGDETLNLEPGVNLAIGKLDGRLLADYVAQRTKRFAADLSSVELEDTYISEKAFYDTSGWDKPRNLQNLPSFLNRYSSKPGRTKTLSAASNQLGSPHTLIVTSAGLRAADLTRALRTFQNKESMIAKLFAKHIKLTNAIEYVKKTRIGIGVGTPSRIIDLFEAKALSPLKLERVVVDCSQIDTKKRGILDMRETHQPLMLLLNRPEIKSRYDSDGGGIDLIFY